MMKTQPWQYGGVWHQERTKKAWMHALMKNRSAEDSTYSSVIELHQNEKKFQKFTSMNNRKLLAVFAVTYCRHHTKKNYSNVRGSLLKKVF
jgi:hypothetical protein